MEKSVYICGPLTELPEDKKPTIYNFYELIGALAEEVFGVPGFVPHKHCDPVLHKTLTPMQVNNIERNQVGNLTSCLVVVTIAPSWGGGIEVEMAYRSDVPIIILHEVGKKPSRLLLGNPGVKAVVEYASVDDALLRLNREFLALLKKEPGSITSTATLAETATG